MFLRGAMKPTLVRRTRFLGVTAAFAALLSMQAFGQAAKTTARTSDGHPDLSGLYNAATVTPLERPEVFKGKPTATDAEAAKYARDFLDAGNIDRRDPDPRVDVGRAYENIFLDRGTSMARLKG